MNLFSYIGIRAAQSRLCWTKIFIGSIVTALQMVTMSGVVARTLKFVQGQTNREVLMHELIMFDIMTANRDLRIWTLLEGRDIVVDDSNVPPPIGVVSNVGGGSPSSNAKKEGDLNYISGEEGISKMTVPDGFEVNLFADEKCSLNWLILSSYLSIHKVAFGLPLGKPILNGSH
jgi:hypothetical protein